MKARLRMLIRSLGLYSSVELARSPRTIFPVRLLPSGNQPSQRTNTKGADVIQGLRMMQVKRGTSESRRGRRSYEIPEFLLLPSKWRHPRRMRSRTMLCTPCRNNLGTRLLVTASYEGNTTRDRLDTQVKFFQTRNQVVCYD